MSRVSNVLITFSASEQPSKIMEINSFFINAGYECGLVSIEDESLPPGWYGGNKPFESEMLVGAFNFLNTDALISHVRDISMERSFQCSSVFTGAIREKIPCLRILVLWIRFQPWFSLTRTSLFGNRTNAPV